MYRAYIANNGLKVKGKLVLSQNWYSKLVCTGLKKTAKGKRGAGQNKGYLNIFIPKANNEQLD